MHTVLDGRRDENLLLPASGEAKAVFEDEAVEVRADVNVTLNCDYTVTMTRTIALGLNFDFSIAVHFLDLSITFQILVGDYYQQRMISKDISV